MLRRWFGFALLASVGVATRAHGQGNNADSSSPATAARLTGSEPPDWLDPSTGSASVLAHGCDVVSEVTLTVTPSAAYLNVLVVNESREVLAFDPSATLVQLGNAGKRRVRTTERGHSELQPGWQQWLPLELPDKADLKGAGSLAVELLVISPSFGKCWVKSRIVRPAGASRTATYTPYSSLELAWGGGPRLLTTGALHELAPKVGVSLGMEVNGYWALHHGAALDIALETPGSARARDVAPELTFQEKPRIDAAGFFLGYVARWPLTSWLSLTYSPQLGLTPFQLVDGTKGAKVTETVICPRQRLQLTVPFGSLADGHFLVALALAHTYVPYGKLGQLGVAGNLVSAQLLLGFGG